MSFVKCRVRKKAKQNKEKKKLHNFTNLLSLILKNLHFFFLFEIFLF